MAEAVAAAMCRDDTGPRAQVRGSLPSRSWAGREAGSPLEPPEEASAADAVALAQRGHVGPLTSRRVRW